MKQLIALFVILVALVPSAFGQAATRHVFPQVVDGRLADGSQYLSFLTITNLSGIDASCTYATSGITIDRFALAPPQTLQTWYTYFTITKGQAALTTGYVVVQCSQPVQASMMYGYIDRYGNTVSMATVFSAPSVSYASIPVISGVGGRYGIAIANTGSLPLAVLLTLNTTTGTTTRTVTVPANSQSVKFVDELITLPSTAALNVLEFTAASQFNLTALLFDGAAFTTLVPAVMP